MNLHALDCVILLCDDVAHIGPRFPRRRLFLISAKDLASTSTRRSSRHLSLCSSRVWEEKPSVPSNNKRSHQA
jgi:hypothetical protein